MCLTCRAMSRTARRVFLLAALISALVLPAHASAANVGDAYRDYATDGSLDACKYSAAELQALLSSVPTDIAQYDPRFVDELNRALDGRASGACSKKGKGTPNSALTGAVAGTAGSGGGSDGAGSGGVGKAKDGSPKPVVAAPVATAVPAAAEAPEIGSDRGFPVALGVLAALLGLVLFGTAVWAARRNGWSPAAFFQGVREGFGR